MGWIVFAGIVSLAIQAVFATVFANYAEEKGYDRSPYFWACFLLGVIGYCMVASLPDLKMREKLNSIQAAMQPPRNEHTATSASPAASTIPTPPTTPAKRATSTVPTAPATPTSVGNGNIVCPNCGKEQLPNRKVCWNCGQKFTTE